MCPPQFKIYSLLGTKSKQDDKGRCIWTAFYVNANDTSINEDQAVSAGNLIANNNPSCGIPIRKGRGCQNNMKGVMVKWRKSNCDCGQFFDLTRTMVNNIDRYSVVKKTSYKRGKLSRAAEM